MAVKIVAEIGSNHCGSLELAHRHVEEAAGIGCDAVKFQLFRAHTLTADKSKWAEIRRWELPSYWLESLKDWAHEEGLRFYCTPFSLEACEELEGKIDAVKISAYDLTYDVLVRRAAQIGVPVILSTAMATWAEMAQAVEQVCKGHGGPADITLLQGVAQYPCRLEDMNLSALLTMKARSRYCQVGISDHTLGIEAALACVCMGGTMIEKHFKLPWVKSPDAGHSMEPKQMGILVERVREIEVAMGTGKKEGPLPCEIELFKTCRRTDEKPLRR